VPLTSYPGYETDLALSPDGKQVAFIWDGGNEGVRHLYVKLVDGGEPLQRTEGSVQHSSPTWSPDGTRVVFLRHLEADTNEILEITALGGEPRRLGTTTVNSSFHGFVGSHGLSFSPDGKLLAIVDRDSADEPDAIFLLSTETGKKRRVTSPPPDRNPWGDSRPAFSPDGRTLAFLRQWENEDVEIYVQPLGAEEATRVAAADLFAWDVEWTPDGKTLVFSTGPTFANSYLVKVPVTGGPPSQLLIGKRARYLSIARGGRLAYSEWLQDVNTWRVGGPKSAEPSSPTQFLASTRDDMMPAYSPDGTKLAFISDRAGTWEVWISNADGTNPRQLTHLGHAIWPRWSPTGRTIAFNSMQGARSHVYVVDASGGFPEVLTEGFMADWSADERWIYFSSLNGRDAQIWKIPARGGQPTQLTKNGGMGPQKGPDGQVFYSRDGRVWSVSAEGGESAAVVDQTVNWDQWCVWRSNLVFLSPKGEKGPSIAVFNLTTRETTELVALGPEMKPSFGLNVSPDGRSILYTRKDRSGSDLMLVENFH
jgi:Tol biopolymer transport system component